jgi:hypothetical protein
VLHGLQSKTEWQELYNDIMLIPNTVFRRRESLVVAMREVRPVDLFLGETDKI